MAKDIYVPSPHAWRSQILISLAERNYLKNTSLGLLHFLLRDCHPCCRSCFCRSLIQLPLITASCTKKTWNWSGFIWTVQNLTDILRQGAVVSDRKIVSLFLVTLLWPQNHRNIKLCSKHFCLVTANTKQFITEIVELAQPIKKIH